MSSPIMNGPNLRLTGRLADQEVPAIFTPPLGKSVSAAPVSTLLPP